MTVFLIDADNLNSGAWIDEAFQELLATEGPLPVRRAYGSSENLKALADTLRAWAVRPFVNLALTKNTTDMALAVDAMELACQHPAPRLVVIGSGDADFTPLVVRLRERGIRVVCVSERSKMGREAMPAYDRLVLVGPVQVAPDAQGPEAPKAAARKVARKTATKKTASSVAASETVIEAPAQPRAKAAPVSHPPAKKAATKKPTRSTAAPAPQVTAEPPLSEPKKPASRAPEKAASSPTRQPPPAAIAPETSQTPSPEVAAILDALPALRTGQPQPINGVTKALRDAELLGKNAASPKLLRKLSYFFELLPAENPNQVRYRLSPETP